MHILCFSDIHGNVAAVRRLIKDVRARGARYEAVIVAGDLTNFSVTHDHADSQRALDAIVETLNAEFDNVWYVPGNRDYFGRGKKKLALEHHRGHVIEEGKKYYLAPLLPITTTPELADKRTILVQHSNVVSERGPKRRSLVCANSLLHITGHTHTGVRAGNYLNTGFLYRDDSNGAEPMLGGYFDVELTKKGIEATFHSIGPIKQSKLRCKGFSGYIYTPHGRTFPVSLATN